MDTCPRCPGKDPGNGLFCQHCRYHIPGRTFATNTTPPWSEHEALIHSADTQTSIKATDRFLEERSKWTATSGRLRKWEADRKKEWAKNKPTWVKGRKKGAL